MIDYAACQEERCPLKGSCARFRMITGSRQSFLIPDRDKLGSDCGYYWPVTKNICTLPPFDIR
jgi:hypothetical protein